MSRLRFNGVAGVLASDLTDTATTIDLLAKLVYAGGDIPTITAPDYLPLSLLGDGGLVVEVVHLTAYTTGGVTGTIVRAQEGSPASAHLTGTVVVHAPTAADLDNLLEPNDLSDATPQAGAATTGVPGTSGDVSRADHRHQVTPAGIGALALTGGTLTGQVVVPVPSIAQHVPRLARAPVAATGDLGLPGYAGNFTGARNITSLLVNGWTANPWILTREGNTVELVGVLNGSAATSDIIMTLPAGYGDVTAVAWRDITIGAVTLTLKLGGANTLETPSRSSIIRFSYRWSVSGASYPSSLPGSAIAGSSPAAWS